MKKRRFKTSYIIATVFTSIGLFFTLFSAIWIHYQNHKLYTFNFTARKGLSSVQSDYNLDVDFEIPVRSDGQPNCWPEENGTWGAQYDIYIYNNSKYPIINWKLKIKEPVQYYIDSSWNGTYSPSDGYIVVEPCTDVNTKILSKDKTKLGFVLYSPRLINIMDYTLELYFVYELNKSIYFIIGLCSLFVGLLTFLVFFLVDYQVKKQQRLSDEKISSLIKICARFIDLRDEYTKMHSTHVAEYSKLIAKEMGYDESFQKNMYFLGMLHDTGKVLIPKEIICKPNELDDDEWNEMKNHTVYGGKILNDFEGLKDLKNVALHHHERYDGTGYPDQLFGEEIPLEARIVCVADSYDAMNTNRSYRKKLAPDVIMNELIQNKGTQFDPKVIDAIISLINKGEL